MKIEMHADTCVLDISVSYGAAYVVGLEMMSRMQCCLYQKKTVRIWAVNFFIARNITISVICETRKCRKEWCDADVFEG
jgi:hypothetical protein